MTPRSPLIDWAGAPIRPTPAPASAQPKTAPRHPGAGPLPPRTRRAAGTEERAAAAGAPAPVRSAGAPASPLDRPRPYVTSDRYAAVAHVELQRRESDALRHLIERATATTLANPARRWAPGTRPPESAA